MLYEYNKETTDEVCVRNARGTIKMKKDKTPDSVEEVATEK